MQKFLVGLMVVCGLCSVVSAEQTIVVDPITKTIKVIGDTTTGSGSTVSSGAVAGSGTTTPNTPAAATGSTTQAPSSPTTTTPKTEFDRALAWMYEKGMTSYGTSATYFPQNDLTREQFAKMVNKFYIAMGYDTSTKNTSCNFGDIGGADPTLISHIKETCRLGIFRGYNGSFMPFKNITKAEVLAVLLRIYNQKKLDETRDPRWSDYYVQAKVLGVTQAAVSTMDQHATREVIALYMWRLHNAIDKERRTESKTSTSTVTSGGTNNLTNSLVSKGSIGIAHDAVLVEAVHSMYEDGMIDFDTLDDTKLYRLITRAEAARLLDIFGRLYVNNYTAKSVPHECLFGDIAVLSLTMQKGIKQLCAMGVMKGDASSGKFFPSQVVTKAQFVTAVVRMVDGVQTEDVNPWWENYYKKALAWKLITSEDRTSFGRDMAMVEAISLMHKLKIHALMGNAKNITQRLSNEFMRMMKNGSSIKAYIDSDFLRNIDNKVGYVLLENDKRYKVVRDHIDEYNSGRLVRYGSLYDVVTDKIVGSLWFITQKGHVIQGTVRLTSANQFYTITADQNSYDRYTIAKTTR